MIRLVGVMVAACAVAVLAVDVAGTVWAPILGCLALAYALTLDLRVGERRR